MVGIARRVAAIVGWFRAGYPEGLPASDYVPFLLFALPRRRLSDEEAKCGR